MGGKMAGKGLEKGCFGTLRGSEGLEPVALPLPAVEHLPRNMWRYKL